MAESGRKKSGPKQVKRITRWEDGSTSPRKQRWSQGTYTGSTSRGGSTRGPAMVDPFTGQKRTGGVYTPPKTDLSKISTKKPPKGFTDPAYVVPLTSPLRPAVNTIIDTAWKGRKGISPGIAALSAINGTKKKGPTHPSNRKPKK